MSEVGSTIPTSATLPAIESAATEFAPVHFTFEELRKFETGDYAITKAELVGTTLKVSVSFGGGAPEHSFGLAIAALASSANPVSGSKHYRAHLTHTGGGGPGAMTASEDLEFDLSRLAAKPFTLTLDDRVTLAYVPPGIAAPATAPASTESDIPAVSDATTVPEAAATGAPSLGDAYIRHVNGRPTWFTFTMASGVINAGNILAKGIVENADVPDGEFSKAFPILPYPSFGLWRVGNEAPGLKEEMSLFLDDAVQGASDPEREKRVLQGLEANDNLHGSTKEKVKALVEKLHDEDLKPAKKKAIARRIEYLIGGANDHEGLDDFQDSWTLSVGILNLALTNYFISYQVGNPPVIRTDGQPGFGFGILNHVMEPQHLADTAAFLIPNHQLGTTPGDIALRALATGVGMWTVVNGGILWKGIEPLFDASCGEVKLSYFDGDAAACEAYLGDRANGNDAAHEFAFDDPTDKTSKDPDYEGLIEQSKIPLHAAKGSYRQAQAYGYSLIFQETELDGRPTWFSLAGLVPFALDIGINAKLGQPLNGFDILQRGALMGGAFFLNSISTDPDLNVPISRSLAYAAKSPAYMTIVSGTTGYNDPLAFLTPNQSGYDNPDSILVKTAPFAIGGYSLDSFWNGGVMSGYALTTSDGLQQWGPLATTAIGFGLQATYNGDEGNLKYMGLGALSIAGGVGFGALMGGTEFGRTIMAMNPRVSYDPVTDTVSGGITYVPPVKKK